MVLLALIFCGVSFAPAGLAASSVGYELFAPGIGRLAFVFSVLLLGLAIYAVRTRVREHSSLAILALWTIGALNFAGCVAEISDLNKALG
jgi:hypothetical protein